MTDARKFCPKIEQTPFGMSANSIAAEPSLYEYAFTGEEIRFEVVKVVSIFTPLACMLKHEEK